MIQAVTVSAMMSGSSADCSVTFSESACKFHIGIQPLTILLGIHVHLHLHAMGTLPKLVSCKLKKCHLIIFYLYLSGDSTFLTHMGATLHGPLLLKPIHLKVWPASWDAIPFTMVIKSAGVLTRAKISLLKSVWLFSHQHGVCPVSAKTLWPTNMAAMYYNSQHLSLCMVTLTWILHMHTCFKSHNTTFINRLEGGLIVK